MRASPAASWLERLLLVIGMVCLGWYGYVTAETMRFHREQAVAFDGARAGDIALPVPARRSSSGALRKTPTTAARSKPAVVGMLEIPRLHISTPVVAGDDSRALRKAAGHLTDTPRPGEPGNSAIAAHRDGLFRPLEHVKAGDVVRIRTTQGLLEYRVERTNVVEPNDLSVLAPTDTETLTLITCYPFRFIGPAPKRFIVRAQRVD